MQVVLRGHARLQQCQDVASEEQSSAPLREQLESGAGLLARLQAETAQLGDKLMLVASLLTSELDLQELNRDLNPQLISHLDQTRYERRNRAPAAPDH